MNLMEMTDNSIENLCFSPSSFLFLKFRHYNDLYTLRKFKKRSNCHEEKYKVDSESLTQNKYFKSTTNFNN